MNLKGRISKTKSGLRSPTEAVSYERQSAKCSRDNFTSTVKLGNKELFDKEQIGIKEPFPVTNLPCTS